MKWNVIYIIIFVFAVSVWLFFLYKISEDGNRKFTTPKTIDSLHYDGYNLAIYIRDTVFTYHLNVQPINPLVMRKLPDILSQDSVAFTLDTTSYNIYKK